MSFMGAVNLTVEKRRNNVVDLTNLPFKSLLIGESDE